MLLCTVLYFWRHFPMQMIDSMIKSSNTDGAPPSAQPHTRTKSAGVEQSNHPEYY
jgi:hypothetical protein